MNKALPYSATAPARSSRNGGPGVAELLWLGCPLLAGAALIAASAGQIGWWPGATLVGLYGLRQISRVLMAEPQALVGVEPLVAVSVDDLGIASREEGQLSAQRLYWAEVQQVDVLTQPASGGANGLCFVLTGAALPMSEGPRHVLVPGAQAVAARFLDAATAHLGPFDQARLLRALSQRDRGRHTVWQRQAG